MPEWIGCEPEMSEDQSSDRSLLRRFRHGQADAPTQLYLRYAERLQALAARQTSPELGRRLDPEDIVQTVFRTFFRRVAEGSYDVPDGEEIWKLLLVIALNKIRDARMHPQGGQARRAGARARGRRTSWRSATRRGRTRPPWPSCGWSWTTMLEASPRAIAG